MHHQHGSGTLTKGKDSSPDLKKDPQTDVVSKQNPQNVTGKESIQGLSSIHGSDLNSLDSLKG